MKKIILLYIITCFFSIKITAQNKWGEIENKLWKQQQEGDISSKEWFYKLQTVAGEIPNRLTAWYKRTIEIAEPKKEGISLRFKNEKLKTLKNGNVYRKMVLKNDSKAPIVIQRIDATIGGLQEYFYIDGKWILNRKNGTSTCGNSYFNQALKPYHQIEFELSNGGLKDGEQEVKYKIAITIEDTVYESNVINIKLYKNQFMRLKQ